MKPPGPWLAGPLLLTALGGLLVHAARADPPQIDRVEPPALQPGVTNLLTIHGRHLDQISRIWMLHSFACEILPPDGNGAAAGRRQIRIRVPSNAPVGWSALRVMGADGVSSLQAILIDDLPALTVGDVHRTRDAALRIRPPVALDGTLASRRSDFFHLRAATGQVLSFEALSSSIGSPADPLVRLTNPDGAEVFYMDDAPGLGAEAAVRHRFETSGDHLLEIRDATFRGGDAYHYRLRVGDVPLVGLTYPPSLEAPGPLQLLGPLRAEERPIHQELVSVGRGPAGWLLNARLEPSGRRGSAWVPASPLPCLVESEPNDASGQAVDLHPPVRVQGRLETRGDRDIYRLEVDAAEAGRTLEVRARTRELGSPCDLWMEWRSEDDRSVRRLRPDAGDLLTNRFEAPGVYFLLVEELNRTGHPDFVYELDAAWREPGFSLSAERDVISMRPGEPGRIKIKLERRGYEGPVRLEAEDLPATTTLGNTRLEGEAEEVALEIVLGPEAGPGTLLDFGLLGRALDGGGGRAQRVSTLPALRRQWREMRTFPPGLDGRFMVVVLPSGE